MSLRDFIHWMPKAEIHVHLEGAMQPETLLMLANRHGIDLPTNTVEGLREWYRFTDFRHFVEIYFTMSACLRSSEDIELIAREFLSNQAAQQIWYTEATYTPYTHYQTKGLSYRDQLAALNRARTWAANELGVHVNWVIDIPRQISPEEGLIVADWVIDSYGDGVVALGLGGDEYNHAPEKFSKAFARARAAGVPCVPHAGETAGPNSIWGALNDLGAVRLGHGVRCIEDADLVAVLRERQIPLEVNPTSNVCLGVAPSIAQHQLPALIEAGLYVTINSDDPPMFNTSLTNEFIQTSETYGWNDQMLEYLTMNAVRAALIPQEQRAVLEEQYRARFAELRTHFFGA
jgi:adenosine deaminase